MSTQKYFPIYPDNFTSRYLANNLDIEITPFTACNLNCPFCDNMFMHADYDPQWFEWSIESLAHLIPHSDAKSISVTIAGGEIMHDRYFDYQLWDKWFGNLVALLVDKQYTISVITNLITHKIDQLIDLQKKYKFTISSSFDLEGRFTKQKQVDLFLSNLQLLDNTNIDCELVMIAHKRNINALKDPNHWLYGTFLQLYKTHTIVIDQYNDRNKLPDYNVSDEQLVDFFKWILINFPNIHGFEKFYNRSITKAGNCDKNTIDLLPFSVRWSCCDKKKQFSRLVDKFGCLTCPHIDYCVPDCPTDALKHNVCINRLMYDYVETTEKFKNKINK